MTVQVEDRERTLRLALADTLADEGALRDDRWRKAVEEVPRHVFVPAYWRLGPDGQPLRVERDDPAWLEGTYADAALTVQMTDGVATSSSTAPSLMLRMLEALDVDDTALVQEIGTGTGYNTALLCHRLSSEQVVTVEVDPQLADAAEARLNMLGWHPAVRVGDGALGVVGTRRFDALIATCAMPDIPGAWLTQTRPGAVLVVPVGIGVVRLVRDENGTASGSFQPWPAFFMAARDAGETGAVPYPGEPASVTERQTNLAPHEVAADNFAFACSLLLPHTACGRTRRTDHLNAAMGPGRVVGRRRRRHRPAGRSRPPVGRSGGPVGQGHRRLRPTARPEPVRHDRHPGRHVRVAGPPGQAAVSGREKEGQAPPERRTVLASTDRARKAMAMRLVFEDNEKQPILEQAVEADEAGKTLLAASLRGIAENGIDLSRDWETKRIELFAAHGIDVTGTDGDARVA